MGKLPYKNPNDPRTFLYLSSRHKWCGVILNFAYVRSRIFYLLTLTGILIGLIAIKDRPLLSLAGLILWLTAWQIFYFFSAARDLKKYPGAPSFRD
ncbi:MAG: hypothetical protein E7038_08195 [Lentisphaerae bacterium]|nr:hypothetical protein [Lentisphaerota bacterium]